MPSDHWRDLHREQGRFKARPGARGFVPAEGGAKAKPGPFRVWASRAMNGEARPPNIRASALALPKSAKDWIRMSDDVARPDNPPAWVADEDTWERAKDAVKKSWDEYDEPYAVVAHVYENMGGETK